MSAAKPAIATGAIILILAAIPLTWQESKASKMRQQIGGLESRRTAAAAKIADHEAKMRALESTPAMQNTRTVRDLLAHSEKRIDIEEMMDSILQVMMSQDIIGMLKIFLPLADLDREEYNRLLEDLENYEGSSRTKMMVIQMMTMFAPTDNPSEALERLVRLEVEPYSYANLLGQWASDDPDAALDWYRQKLDAGELDGKGIDARPEQYLLAELIGGMAKKDPKLGVDYFIESVGSMGNNPNNAASRLANSLGLAIKKKGDDSQLKRLLAWDTQGAHSAQILESAMRSALHEKEFGEVTRFAETYLDSAEKQQSTVISYVVSQRNEPVAERAQQLLSYLPEERAPGAIQQLTNSGYVSNSIDPETTKWVESQPPGPVRDAGWRGITENHMLHQSFEEAYTAAENIGDEAKREEAMVQLGDQWVRNDEEAATAALPPELVEKIEQRRQGEHEAHTHVTFEVGPNGETIETRETIEAPVEN